MKTKSPSEPKPKNLHELDVDSHGAWANVWQPAWDSAADQSNKKREAEENSQDDSLDTKSPRTSSTPSEEQRD